MALALGTNKGSWSSSTSNPINVTGITLAANSKVFVLMLLNNTSTDRTGGVPTFGGVNMSQVGSTVNDGTEWSVEMWRLYNPSLSSSTLSIPNSGALTIFYYYISLTGNAASVFGSLGTFNTSTNPSIGPINNVPAGGACVAVMGDGYKNAPSGASHTILADTDQGAFSTNAQYGLIASLSNVTMSWTLTTSDNWAGVMGAFQETAINEKSLDAAFTPGAGQAAKLSKRVVDRTFAPGNAQSFKKTLRSLSATFTPTRTLGKAKEFFQSLSAGMSFVASLATAKNLLVSLSGMFSSVAGVVTQFIPLGGTQYARLFFQANKNLTTDNVLSFTATESRGIGKVLAAIWQSIGVLVLEKISGVIKQSLEAGIQFTGQVVKGIGKLLYANLFSTGVLSTIKGLITKSLEAGIQFTGGVAKRVGFHLSAVLHPTGILTTIKNLRLKSLAAGLQPVGRIVKRTSRALSAALSFAGLISKCKWITYGSGIIYGTGDVYHQCEPIILSQVLTAALSFVGDLTRAITLRPFVAGLSFIGQVFKQVHKALEAGVDFVATLGRPIFHVIMDAGMAFSSEVFKKTLLSLRRTLHTLAELDKIAIISGVTKYYKVLAGTLGSDGAVFKSVRHKVAGVLHPIGAVASGAGKIKLLSAVMGFVGRVFKFPKKSLAATQHLYAGLSFTTVITAHRLVIAIEPRRQTEAIPPVEEGHGQVAVAVEGYREKTAGEVN